MASVIANTPSMRVTDDGADLLSKFDPLIAEIDQPSTLTGDHRTSQVVVERQ